MTVAGLPIREAWLPPTPEAEDVGAIQALARGQASPHQQKRALDYIVEQLCMNGDWAFRPGASDRETNIALGRQFVGGQIAYLCKVNIDIYLRSEHAGSKSKPKP